MDGYRVNYDIDVAIEQHPERRACYNCFKLYEAPAQNGLRRFRCGEGHFEDLGEHQIVANRMGILAPHCPDFDTE